MLTMGERQKPATSKVRKYRHFYKGKGKKELEKELREDMKKYDAIYLFLHKDIKKPMMTTIAARPEWSDSKMWFGNNKIVRRTLLHLESFNLFWPNLKEFSEAIKGNLGLLLTNRPQKEIEDWFNSFSFWDYPRFGYQVNTTVTLPAGPLLHFRPVIEPYLRELGMPTAVENDAVVLTADFEMCQAGSLLQWEQVHMFELLGEKVSRYKLKLKAKWTKTAGLQPINNEEESDDEEDGSESD